ncbi:hypothetical protein I6G56_27315 [Burkholderia humptydooensis]|uniref:Uncharacterized protein n=1 Tax=Burkholderia humptydooensis TaxID=430531 RepID=A0A7T2X168_9BURK|nr:hypothetical protein [Burkholderia sp. MSMB1589WGS]AJY40651.1 major facilitator superfamily MFS_1 domain protein [Burkholderia sp. 2002721687]QPS48056.1 hypothetical protein I6G56_27315 [Burkholderia humptydooensis]
MRITPLLPSHCPVADNFAATLFGGFAPFLTAWPVAKTGSDMAPALM